MARRARAAAPAERDASRPRVPSPVPPPTLLLLLLLLVVVAPEAATSATTAPAAAAASAIERNAVTDDAADITAAASFAYASSPSTPLTALGSNVVPGAVHFATYCDESNVAFHEGRCVPWERSPYEYSLTGVVFDQVNRNNRVVHRSLGLDVGSIARVPFD